MGHNWAAYISFDVVIVEKVLPDVLKLAARQLPKRRRNRALASASVQTHFLHQRFKVVAVVERNWDLSNQLHILNIKRLP